MTFPPDLAIFARQLRQLGVNIAWVGSPTTVATTALKLAGPALYGSYAVCRFRRRLKPGSQGVRYEIRGEPTSLRPITMGHGPTTRFMFWRSRSTTLRVLSLRRSARRS